MAAKKHKKRKRVCRIGFAFLRAEIAKVRTGLSEAGYTAQAGVAASAGLITSTSAARRLSRRAGSIVCDSPEFSM